MTKIRELPQHRRPREKLALQGVESLTTSELSMILLGTGTAGRPVNTVARELEQVLKRKGGRLSLDQIAVVNGVGLAKGAAVVAALELSRRFNERERVKIRQPKDVLPFLHEFARRKQEHFAAISLNGNYEVISTRIVTVGLANFCHIHPREVFADVILDRATAVIVAHNHPSGNLTPSPEDRFITSRLLRAARILGISLLDHIIFGTTGFYSLRDNDPELFSRRRVKVKA